MVTQMTAPFKPAWFNAKWRADFAALRIELIQSITKNTAARYHWVVCDFSNINNNPLLVPEHEQLHVTLSRQGKSIADLRDSSIISDLASGAKICWTFVDTAASHFFQLTALRKGVAHLLSEHPEEVTVQLVTSANLKESLTRLSLRCLLVNQAKIEHKGGDNNYRVLRAVHLFAPHEDTHIDDQLIAEERALAESNALVRWLTGMPRSALHPASYRAFCEHEAQRFGWQCRVYRFTELCEMGAGAFVAVAQGSDDDEACIVHLRYTPKDALGCTPTQLIQKKFALVGKGVCMDTGGYNVKSESDMQHMHEDMSGSAVVLALISAISALKLPWQIDAWLAIAENRIGPNAYTPQDVVTSLSGVTIEIVHTDSEGRLLLADALTLARRAEPEACIVDFATLTGAMVRALGNRMSGTFTNTSHLGEAALTAAADAGERIAVFPLEADYDEDLKSELADIKHTNFDVGGGAILAARFLQRFAGGQPWMHVDLSSWRHTGGLGAVSSDLTGFGVYWGYALLEASSMTKAPQLG
jgi:leucyl aminopeptidase